MVLVHSFLIGRVVFEEFRLHVLSWWCLCCHYEDWNTIAKLFLPFLAFSYFFGCVHLYH
jgi:hypothetical protein